MYTEMDFLKETIGFQPAKYTKRDDESYKAYKKAVRYAKKIVKKFPDQVFNFKYDNPDETYLSHTLEIQMYEYAPLNIEFLKMLIKLCEFNEETIIHIDNETIFFQTYIIYENLVK